MRCKDTIKTDFSSLFSVFSSSFPQRNRRCVYDNEMMIIYPDMCLYCMKVGICCLLMVRKVNKMFYISGINS